VPQQHQGASGTHPTRLVGLGLVVTEPHVGYKVMPVTVEDLMELTDARLEMESLDG